MSQQHSYQAYSRANHTVAKTRQVVMLYDGAIRFLQHAKVAMESGDINERYTKLVKAGDVVAGLQSCLDFESGGHTAQILYDFYSATEMRILTLHRTSDIAECESIIADLKQMREVWNHIDKGKQVAAAPVRTEQPSLPSEDAPPVAAATLTVSA